VTHVAAFCSPMSRTAESAAMHFGSVWARTDSHLREPEVFFEGDEKGVNQGARSDVISPTLVSGPRLVLWSSFRLVGYYVVTMAFSAALLRITRFEPLDSMICRFLRSANSRVTVSRDVPIICAISSCVSANLRHGSALVA